METRKIPTGFVEVMDMGNSPHLVNINHIVHIVPINYTPLTNWQYKYTRIYFAHPYECGISSLDAVGTYYEIVEEIRKAQGIGE